MKRMLLPATAALITLAPSIAVAKPPTAAHAGAYEHTYHRVAHRLGRRVPGRNIVRDGFSAGVPACASESGSNYSTGASNTNGSPGATGRYQILPSTAAGYGCSLATAAGQDACAQTIYQHQGAGAWVGCGG